METRARQSQFLRHIPAGVLVALVWLLAGSLAAADETPFRGDQFFLLSDATYGSGTEALVRLEAAGRRYALEEYSGVDIVVYRVPNPLDFLKRQKNLHRVEVKGDYRGEGIA